ncbi:molybdate ABC transporter substrate-binding protein [Caldimonas brevitalea]|uniref:Molybdate transporter n=1 Tax=Caldimonas brevitalea TaxID=413882 RepID=A0A0G3BNF9_9BURK|nr:molybdate ABC transporter substrate-binding protein [Caldimonas brevitalea]AKJ30937.1 molybdate transporter [Caldimonas brevitalea]
MIQRTLRHWLAVFAFAATAPTVAAADLTVFGAASLSDALREIGHSYRAATGEVPRFSLAASSTLARQIEAGAQAQLFISADRQWMDYLAERRLIEPATRTDLLGNRLVLVTPADRPRTVTLAPGFDLGALLGPQGRLATGDPSHVPAGKYAQAALTWLGSWAVAQPRLVRTDSVRAALALVERGEVPAAIVYATDAAAARGVHVAAVFPAESHPPIVYPAAVVATGEPVEREAARRLLAWLRSAPASAVFRKHGFAVLTPP